MTTGLIFAARRAGKTRRGKVLRRVLKAQKLGLDPEDISTMEE